NDRDSVIHGNQKHNHHHGYLYLWVCRFYTRSLQPAPAVLHLRSWLAVHSVAAFRQKIYAPVAYAFPDMQVVADCWTGMHPGFSMPGQYCLQSEAYAAAIRGNHKHPILAASAAIQIVNTPYGSVSHLHDCCAVYSN